MVRKTAAHSLNPKIHQRLATAYRCDESCRKAFWMNPERYLPWKSGKPDRRKKMGS